MKRLGRKHGIEYADGSDFGRDLIAFDHAMEVECRGQRYDPGGPCWTDNEDTFEQLWIHIPSRKVNDYWDDEAQESGDAAKTHYAIFRHDFRRCGVISGQHIITWVNRALIDNRENAVDDGVGVFYKVPYALFSWFNVETGEEIRPNKSTHTPGQ